ncbi:sel1 repeat family protein [Chlorobium phaeovibrioides]|uniref:Sel1 repeat family protein n=1 Tax=Chlorobium phaeovibrioides TaxID=1094 RepID=A0A5M8I5Q8_CHLPH|nr:sel1 repeat family protein [Chlorobium phaeovibrioides]
MAEAQLNLALLYNAEGGNSRNPQQALKWFRLAAEQGEPQAQYNIGAMYALGDGVQQNDTTAVKWFTLAAKQGKVLAEYHLPLHFIMAKEWRRIMPSRSSGWGRPQSKGIHLLNTM